MGHLRQIEGSDFDYDKEALEKFTPEIDICLGDYDKKGVINTNMAIFAWDNSVFMTEEEYKDLPAEKKVKVHPAKMFDLSKAERVIIKKEEMKV